MDTAKRISTLAQRGIDNEAIAAILGLDHLEVAAFDRDPQLPVRVLPSTKLTYNAATDTLDIGAANVTKDGAVLGGSSFLHLEEEGANIFIYGASFYIQDAEVYSSRLAAAEGRINATLPAGDDGTGYAYLLGLFGGAELFQIKSNGALVFRGDTTLARSAAGVLTINGTPIPLFANITEDVGGLHVSEDLHLRAADTLYLGSEQLFQYDVGILSTSSKLTTLGGLGVGNSAAASTPGTVVKKMQVFDQGGTPLGYVPIYDAIT